MSKTKEDFFGATTKEFENKALRMRRAEAGIIVLMQFPTKADLIKFSNDIDTPTARQNGWGKTAKVKFDSLKSKRNPFGF